MMNLPKYKKNKKYHGFPSNWRYLDYHLHHYSSYSSSITHHNLYIHLNGVYINPEDTRKYPYPISTVSADDFEYSCEDEHNIHCSACNVTFYCSKECQKKDWTDGHKEECKELTK